MLTTSEHLRMRPSLLRYVQPFIHYFTNWDRGRIHFKVQTEIMSRDATVFSPAMDTSG